MFEFDPHRKHAKYLQQYVEKYPDRVGLVNTIIAVYHLGALDPVLCKILTENTARVVRLSDIKIINDNTQGPGQPRKIRTPEAEADTEEAVKPVDTTKTISDALLTGKPVSVNEMAKRLNLNPTTIPGRISMLRRTTLKGQNIVAIGTVGDQVYQIISDGSIKARPRDTTGQLRFKIRDAILSGEPVSLNKLAERLGIQPQTAKSYISIMKKDLLKGHIIDATGPMDDRIYQLVK